jgi:Rac GTPase-activating protein 1
MNIVSKNLQCECKLLYNFTFTEFLACKICVHEQCKKRAPVPCLPASSFPTTPGRNFDAKLALPDYCPANPPFIPAMLIRCVCALEKNCLNKEGLNKEGIYHVSG